MGGVGRFFMRLIGGLGLLVLTLFFEILLAIGLYVYFDTQQPELFAQMIAFANNSFQWIEGFIEGTAPELHRIGSQSILGDYSGRAFLLLFLGLLASGVIRMIAWFIRSLMPRRDRAA